METSSIIILSYNHWKYTARLLDSLQKTQSLFEVIVLDNGSDIETKNALIEFKRRHKNSSFDLQIILSDKNMGVSSGRNYAAQKANGKYLCFLDNDVVIDDSNWLEQLKLATKSPGLGVAGGVLLDFDNPDSVQFMGGSVDLKGNICFKEGNTADLDMLPLLMDSIFCIGACFLIPRIVWNKLEGFDSTYDPYDYEDIDFCFRAKEIGFTCVLVNSCRLRHASHSTIGTKGFERLRRYIINGKKFRLKWQHMFKLLKHDSSRYDSFIYSTVPIEEDWGCPFPPLGVINYNLNEVKAECLRLRQLVKNDLSLLLKYKMVNYRLALLETSEAVEHCTSLPFTVQASRTQQCNLSCIYCRPNSTDILSVELKEWENVLHTLLPSALEFMAYGWGESLIDPYFAKTCKLAGKYKTPLALISNLQFFPLEISRLVQKHCSRLLVSVDSCNPDIYHDLRRGASWDLLETNLQTLTSLENGPWVGISVVLTKQTLKSFPKLINWAAKMNVKGIIARRIVLRENINNFFKEEMIDLKSSEFRKICLEARKNANAAGIVLNIAEVDNQDYCLPQCNYPWQHVYYDPSGVLCPCCYTHEHPIGKIDEDFWNNNKIKHLRHKMSSGFRCSECAGLDVMRQAESSQMRG